MVITHLFAGAVAEALGRDGAVVVDRLASTALYIDDLRDRCR